MSNSAQIFEALLTSQRANGVTLSGGKAYFYTPGTLIKKNIYTTRAKTVVADNPYTLDSNGQATVYGDGLYDVQVKNSTGSVSLPLWEDVQIKDYSGELAYNVSDYADLEAAVAAIGSTRATLVFGIDQTVSENLTIPATMELKSVNEAKITVATGKTLTINGPFESGSYQIFAGSGTVTFGNQPVSTVWGVSTGGYLPAGDLNPLDFPGNTLSRKIQAAFDYAIANYGIPITITVPMNTGNSTNNAYEWDTTVDLSTDAWVTLKSQGMVYVKATAAISSFISIGVGNKNNETMIQGFSFDAYNQNMDAAIKIGASRGCIIDRVELKGTGSGQFTDGILLDESIHTGTESGSGFEGNALRHIYDSGDGKIYRSIVRVDGPNNSQALTIDDIRAVGDNFESVVGVGANTALNYGRVSHLQVNSSADRTTKAKALLHILGKINETSVTGLQTKNHVIADYAVKIESTGLCSGVFMTNLGNGYAIGQKSISSFVINAFHEGLLLNAGNPNTSGDLGTHPLVQHDGGVVFDTTNNTFFTKQAGVYRTPVFRTVSSIADDGFLAIDLPATDYRAKNAMVSVAVETSFATSGIAMLQTYGYSDSAVLSGGASFAVGTGVPIGTSGVDGEVTVFADNATGKIYVENRSGATRQFVITFIN